MLANLQDYLLYDLTNLNAQTNLSTGQGAVNSRSSLSRIASQEAIFIQKKHASTLLQYRVGGGQTAQTSSNNYYLRHNPFTCPSSCSKKAGRENPSSWPMVELRLRKSLAGWTWKSPRKSASANENQNFTPSALSRYIRC